MREANLTAYDHLRALAQRLEVDQKELRVMGSKSVLLGTLVAASSAKTAGGCPAAATRLPQEEGERVRSLITGPDRPNCRR
jgi:hypothetical protein